MMTDRPSIVKRPDIEMRALAGYQGSRAVIVAIDERVRRCRIEFEGPHPNPKLNFAVRQRKWVGYDELTRAPELEPLAPEMQDRFDRMFGGKGT